MPKTGSKRPSAIYLAPAAKQQRRIAMRRNRPRSPAPPQFAYLRAFLTWCDERGILSISEGPDVMLAYFRERAVTDGRAILRDRRECVERFYELAGHAHVSTHPDVLAFWLAYEQNIKHTRHSAIPELDLPGMMRACATNPTPESYSRDRLACLMWAKGFSGTELAELLTTDVRIEASCALIATLPTNHMASGLRDVHLPRNPNTEICVVDALEKWLAIWPGPKLFCAIDGWGHLMLKPIKVHAFHMIVRRYIDLAKAAAPPVPRRRSRL